MECKEYFEKVMQDSTIECYVADRSPQYVEIVTDLEKQKTLKRRTCWFHGRRHIALGWLNWLQSGSHDAAKNIAFMFGLLGSCKLNDVNFGEYIEDVLTRIMYGEQVDISFLPCDYVRKYEDGQDDKDAEERYMNLEIKEENVA